MHGFSDAAGKYRKLDLPFHGSPIVMGSKTSGVRSTVVTYSASGIGMAFSQSSDQDFNASQSILQWSHSSDISIAGASAINGVVTDATNVRFSTELGPGFFQSKRQSNNLVAGSKITGIVSETRRSP